MQSKCTETFGYSDKDYKRFRMWAWLMLLSFGLTYLFFYNGRQNINLVMAQMATELGTTTAALGVVSAALLWCYGFGQLISGRLGALLGYKRLMMISIVASAVLNVIISFQSSIGVIATLWGINGVFQSMVWSNGLGVLNTWWPKKKRGFSTGLTTAFSGLAQVVTYLTVLLCLDLNPDWGWRAAFRFPMIPMLLMLIAFFFFFKERPEDVGLAPFVEEDESNARDAELSEKIKSHGFFYPYLMLFSEPKMILFCFISAIAGVGRYGLLTWIPTYFQDALGLSIKQGIISTILLPLGQAAAMFLFPLISDKFLKGKREPILIVASIVTFFGMLAFPFIQHQGAASVMLLLLGMSSMVTGVIWAIAGDIGGRAFAATVVGVLDWSVYMGAGAQSALFGFMQREFGWNSIFVIIGSLYIIMLVLTLIARKIKIKHL